MISVWNEFKSNIDDVKKIGAVYQQITESSALLKDSLADLLRTQLVNTISAFDRMLHEYVRKGLLRQLTGLVPLESKTKNFPIDSDSYCAIMNLGSSPSDWIEKERILENRVSLVLKTMSFQDPEKIKDALSYIWNESHKWQKLALGLGLQDNVLTSQLKLYVERRNQIVHEADYDKTIPGRRPINLSVTQDCISFIYSLARQISIDAVGLSGI